MQAYHNGGQAYYPQPQYQPQPAPYITHYTAGYPQFQPPVVPAQGYQQFPSTYTPEQYEPPPQMHQFPSLPRPKNLKRGHTLATPNPKAVPLKPALKRPQHDRSGSMGTVPAPAQLSRASSRATSEQRQRVNSTTRPRADSNALFTADHIFLAFHGSNEIKMENIAYQTTVDELRQNMVLMWPHGVAAEESRDHRWRCQFSGTPWSSSGRDSVIARHMICTTWAILADQGYSYLTTLNTANPPARLVFVNSPPDPSAIFFSVAISQSGDKFSLLDAPMEIAQTLGNNLRSAFPHKIASDRAKEDGIYVIELKRGVSGSEVDRSVFAAYVLRFFNMIGFKLDGSLPMGKAGPLGFGSRKELWIFRGSQRRPPSAHGQREH